MDLEVFSQLDVPSKARLFEPYYCYRHKDGRLRHFYRSRGQVSMCKDFNKDCRQIIEVDLRVDLTSREPKFFGVVEPDGEIHSVYPNYTLVKVGGFDRRKITPIEVVILDQVPLACESIANKPVKEVELNARDFSGKEILCVTAN